MSDLSVDVSRNDIVVSKPSSGFSGGLPQNRTHARCTRFYAKWS